MGRDCLQIFLNLNLSDDDKKKIDRCLEALDNYFKPSRNVVYERYVFNTCVQTNDESVQSYVTRLRKLATSCEYGELTDDLIRDRLVIGLKHNGDKVRLLREKNLDLKKAIQMCTTSEVAAQQMKKIQSAEDNTEDVKKFDDKKKAHRRRRFKNAPEQQQKSNDKQTKSGAELCAGFTCKYCGQPQRHVKSNGFIASINERKWAESSRRRRKKTRELLSTSLRIGNRENRLSKRQGKENQKVSTLRKILQGQHYARGRNRSRR